LAARALALPNFIFRTSLTWIKQCLGGIFDDKDSTEEERAENEIYFVIFPAKQI
jgi:hypothetical protein